MATNLCKEQKHSWVHTCREPFLPQNPFHLVELDLLILHFSLNQRVDCGSMIFLIYQLNNSQLFDRVWVWPGWVDMIKNDTSKNVHKELNKPSNVIRFCQDKSRIYLYMWWWLRRLNDILEVRIILVFSP